MVLLDAPRQAARTLADRTVPGRRGSRAGLDPRLLAALGSVCIAFSPIFVTLSGATPGTATFFRCVLALPVLGPLAWVERRRRVAGGATAGRGTRRTLLLLGAGACLGVDMTLWSVGITTVGAGVSTVLVNVQVVILPLLAFLVLGERVAPRFLLCVPLMLGGVALAGGLADSGSSGSEGGGPDGGGPLVGGTLVCLLAAACYAGYLLLVRLGSRPGERFAPVGLATLAAAGSSLALGSLGSGVDLLPGWAGFGWLVALALVGQVLGWALIATGLARLPAATGGSILLLQPVGAVLLGVVLLDQVPSAFQLLGCAAVVVAVAAAVRGR